MRKFWLVLGALGLVVLVALSFALMELRKVAFELDREVETLQTENLELRQGREPVRTPPPVQEAVGLPRI